ncbi:hypothetical protein LK07_11345 [Streptomyces pluripotens]|uniref:Uncharacterized protein n=1 Tax=Streptomyces pluripotens TaxID=1355015 RepID=A0A221NX87_9ACTN|nr:MULTISPECIES: hypothetical protein [Streptomyces]ARP70277.1 hypothetical protein LK06_010220 [Streptomyces pluripotens]ASN24534.1 hypothetical protein LK07_11345 [Streptomyces pluripotens]KIE28057.1 hypothetical protein LK08_05125 [Streptomyces sp. MUSC 125]MCH0558377.1 hypothetical protein [Streptomyces sp. MUM 16J]
MHTAADLLPVPKLDGLTDQQARGATCVWDETPLTATTAIDLGERTATEGRRCFPRACRPCAMRKAMDALLAHNGSCEQCVDDHTQCPTGLGLVRAVREARW